MANYRVGRVRQQIMREVSDILFTEIKDPRIKGVTITDIELTRDLRYATIYYSTLSELASERKKTQAGLEASTPLIRSILGGRLTLYNTPEIKFVRDTSVDEGNRIEELLNRIKEEDK